MTHLSMDPQALSAVKRGLEQVVASSSGTGRLAQFSDDVTAAGKTGTAQAAQGLSHAWFCGYIPARKPAYSFVIFLEHGGKGGEQAALVAREALSHMKEFGYL